MQAFLKVIGKIFASKASGSDSNAPEAKKPIKNQFMMYKSFMKTMDSGFYKHMKVKGKKQDNSQWSKL